MIWLTWRQHRLQALAAGLALTVFAGWLFITHLGIARTWQAKGIPACLGSPGQDCSGLLDEFNSHYSNLQFLIPLFLAVPLLLGLFWGAPLVAREIEHGTQRLIWTQGITRRRWIATKVALVGAAAVVATAAFASVVSWWSRLFIEAGGNRFNPGIFDIRGVVPVAYAVFALALAVFAGTAIRRTLPAMAATLAAFIGVRVVVMLFLRPHYMSALTSIEPFGKGPGGVNHQAAGDWILRSNVVDRAGNLVSQGGGLNIDDLVSRCPGLNLNAGPFPSKASIFECAHRLGLQMVETYQPGSRFWAFQGIESAIYLVLGAALIAATVWIVRERLS